MAKLTAPRALALLCFTLILAGCGSNRNPLQVTIQRCPTVVFADETDTWVEFAGDAMHNDQVVFTAMVSNLDLQCDQDASVRSTVTFDVSARAGPALNGVRQVTLPYYVALLRDNSVVVAKKTYEVTFRLGPDAPRAGSREEIVQVIDDIERTRRYDYELVIGFDMGNAAIAYNELR